MILKNKMNMIQHQIKHEDSSNQGFINNERLKIILNKLGIPPTIMDEQDVRSIFQKFKIDDHKFDYKKFLQGLSDFKFTAEDIFTQKEKEEKQREENLTTVQKQIKQFRKVEIDNSAIHIQDSHLVDFSALERIRAKAHQAFNIIKRYFPHKKEFNDYLVAQLGLESSSDLAGKQISKEKLTPVLENIFLNFGEQSSLPKRDMEKFLSVFDYNKHGFAKLEDIGYAIFEEPEEDWQHKMQWKSRKPPPPEELNFTTELPKIKGAAQTTRAVFQQPLDVSVVNQSQVVQDGADPQQSTPAMPAEEQTSILQQSIVGQLDPEIKSILQKVDDNIFRGSQRAYEIFKKLDLDQDGYINHNDLMRSMREKHIMGNDEIVKLISYLDPDQVGYLGFQEFSSKIRNGCTDNDAQGYQITVPTIYPSKELTLAH